MAVNRFEFLFHFENLVLHSIFILSSVRYRLPSFSPEFGYWIAEIDMPGQWKVKLNFHLSDSIQIQTCLVCLIFIEYMLLIFFNARYVV